MKNLATEIGMLTQVSRDIEDKFVDVTNEKDVGDLVKQSTAVKQMIVDRLNQLSKMTVN